MAVFPSQLEFSGPGNLDARSSVATMGDLNAISMWNRKKGMIVTVEGPAGTNPTRWTLNDDLTTWVPFATGGGGGPTTADQVLFSKDIPIDKSTPSLPVGFDITAITSVEKLVETMFSDIQAPTLSLAGSPTTTQEIGSNITPTLTPTWNQRDGGAITQYRLKKGGATIFTNATAVAHTDAQFQLTTNVTYQAEADHAAGAVITAGTVTSGNVTYTAVRRGFYGALGLSPVVPSNSAQVRALPSSINNPANSSTMVVDVGPSNQGIIFAYPATLREATSIIIQSVGSDVKGSFTQTTVSVEGANGYSPINYRVYALIPAIPFLTERYTLTI